MGDSTHLGELMTTLPLSARLVGPALFMRRMRRQLTHFWYRDVLPLFLPTGPSTAYRTQIVVLLVIIPSILAGILVAQTSGQFRMPTSLLHP